MGAGSNFDVEGDVDISKRVASAIQIAKEVDRNVDDGEVDASDRVLMANDTTPRRRAGKRRVRR